MKVLLSWLRDFVEISEPAEEIGRRMSMRGFALEGLEPRPDGDAVLDFEVTSNRPDCLSVLGMAREIATAYGLPWNAQARPRAEPEVGKTLRAINDTIPVTIDDADLCGRYVAAIADVTIGPSPPWMQERLEASGVRSINNVVDVTNYVLLELGHPMHAFDFARLAGPAIVVRRARPGEQLTTLDGKARALAPEMLVIADAERASAIGGVMGGAASEVSATTTRIVLESAWFKPQSVRATSKHLGLRTEASYRFERGADVLAAPTAMKRALSLLSEIGGTSGFGAPIDVYPQPQQPIEVTLDAPSIRGLLGMDVPAPEVERILRSLGFTIHALGGWQAAAPDSAIPMGGAARHGWRVGVPSWRTDIHRPVDLIEEVGRHHGFEHLPATFPALVEVPGASDPRIARDWKIRRALLAMGFSEAITFAFTETGVAVRFAEGQQPVTLANPLSEKFTTLRQTLISGLVDALSHNRRHGRRDVQLFEVGTRFSRNGETRAAAGAWMGAATPEHWSGAPRPVDFFDVKGAAETVCAVLGIIPTIGAATASYLVEGRRAEFSIDGHTIGLLGQLNPAIAESREVPANEPIYVFEIDLDAVSARVASTPKFVKPLPRHPAVMRDIAIMVDDTLSAETVRGTIRAANPANLVDLREFDRYQGKGIPEGKVSLALRLTFQAPDRTLTDAEVQSAMHVVVEALKRDLGAVQR